MSKIYGLFIELYTPCRPKQRSTQIGRIITRRLRSLLILLELCIEIFILSVIMNGVKNYLSAVLGISRVLIGILRLGKKGVKF